MSAYEQSREEVYYNSSLKIPDSNCTKPSNQIPAKTPATLSQQQQNSNDKKNHQSSLHNSQVQKDKSSVNHTQRVAPSSRQHHQSFAQTSSISSFLPENSSIPQIDIPSEISELPPRSFFISRNLRVSSSRLINSSIITSNIFSSSIAKSQEQSAIHKIIEESLNKLSWSSKPNEDHGDLLTVACPINPIYLAPR